MMPSEHPPLFLDIEILSRTITIVEEHLQAAGKTLDAGVKAVFIRILYERFFRSGGQMDSKTVEAYLKLFG